MPDSRIHAYNIAWLGMAVDDWVVRWQDVGNLSDIAQVSEMMGSGVKNQAAILV